MAVGERCDLSRIRRVVDVGCGKGHLTAALRSSLNVPALGLDFDAELLVAARTLYPAVEFEARDIVDNGLPIRDGDLVVGLHPCGCLGEAVVASVANLQKAECGECGECSEEAESSGAGATLLMVPCCWHKQRAPTRAPLSSVCASADLHLPHHALKKASMAMDASQSVPSRRARYELRELLRIRGVDAETLANRREMDGIHPRKALRGLATLAAECFRKRGIEPAATDEELAEAARVAHGKFERSRRLSLLEPMLGALAAVAVADAGAALKRYQRYAIAAVSALTFASSVASTLSNWQASSSRSCAPWTALWRFTSPASQLGCFGLSPPVPQIATLPSWVRLQ